MATESQIFNAALMSSEAYAPKGTNLGDWVVVDDRRSTSESGFNAVTFLNNATKEAYIVYRGTELSDPGDLGADFGLAGGNKHAQFDEAINYYTNTVSDLRKDGPVSVTVAGHSLGGGACSVCRYSYWRNDYCI